MSMESVIDIRHLRKSFGAHEVLKDIDFSVGKGEVACIIGSSGSGKSTLLRCINLLEMQRRSVLLPEPEEPMMQATSPLPTEKSMSLSTSCAPKDLRR